MYRPLRRNPCNQMLGGICAGIADYFDTSPTFIRILYVLISICSVAFPGILVYLLMWIIIPQGCCCCDYGCDCDDYLEL